MSYAVKLHGWRLKKLIDLVFFQRGFDVTQAQQKLGPYPVISSSGATSYHNEFKASGPGIIIGRKGTLGSIHFTVSDYWPHNTTLWSKNLKGNNPRFVYYFLHTFDFKRLDVGNSNPTLNRNHIHDISIQIPPVEIQERIASMVRLRLKHEVDNLMVGVFIESDAYKSYVQSRIGGAAQPNANVKVLAAAEILVPSPCIQRNFHEFVEPMIDQCEILQQQNQKLRTTRDLLLPRLMSGEIAV